MKEHRETTSGDIEIHLGESFAVLRPHWWKIAGLSLAVGGATLLFLLTKPNIYRSTAVILPVEDENKRGMVIGALAGFGLPVGGSSKLEDLEVLFKSNDLTVRVFTNHDHWETLLGDSYNPVTKKVTPGILSILSSGRKEPGPPDAWDAIRASEEAKSVSLNRKTGSLTISFESTSPEESAAILNEYLVEAKSRLQEEAFIRAAKNKKFIEEQIGKTIDALTRDRLYALLGQEVEREMMARNREQFGFRVFDAPRVPDRKSRPSRIRVSLSMSILTLICVGIVYLLKERRNEFSKRRIS